MAWHRATIAITAWFSLVALLPASAAAQGVEAAQDVPSQAPKSEHERLIERAKHAFGVGNLVEARTLLQEAHAQKPGFQTLKMLALVEFELQSFSEAMLYVTRAEAHEMATTEMRTALAELKARIQRNVAQYTVVIEPQDGTVMVDGRAIELDPEGYLWLNAGEHAVVARAPYYVEEARNIKAIAGAVGGVLRFELRHQDDLVEEEESSGGSVFPWVLVGTGGALVIGAGVTGILALGEQGTLEDDCPNKTCTDVSLEDTADNVDTLALVTDILWISGAVVAGVGITLLVLDGGSGEQAEEEASLELVPTAGRDGAGVIAIGRF